MSDGDIVGSQQPPIVAFVCKNSDGSEYNAQWKIYYPDCRNKFFLCNSGSGAFVSAITVCIQGLT